MHAASIAVLTLCIYAPAPRERALEKGPSAIERKLHGIWRGQGGCTGNLTLRADGTYQHDGQGPGGDTSAGAWEVRWDALPPTLVLTCKTSTRQENIGMKEVKLTELNDEDLMIEYAKGLSTRFKRVKK
jgi:hypothetical protein